MNFHTLGFPKSTSVSEKKNVEIYRVPNLRARKVFSRLGQHFSACRLNADGKLSDGGGGKDVETPEKWASVAPDRAVSGRKFPAWPCDRLGPVLRPLFKADFRAGALGGNSIALKKGAKISGPFSGPFSGALFVLLNQE